jgi:hypothetical protein
MAASYAHVEDMHLVSAARAHARQCARLCVQDNGRSVRMPSSVQQCSGVSAVHDVQLSELFSLSQHNFRPLTKQPVEVFTYVTHRKTHVIFCLDSTLKNRMRTHLTSRVDTILLWTVSTAAAT